MLSACNTMYADVSNLTTGMIRNKAGCVELYRNYTETDVDHRACLCDLTTLMPRAISFKISPAVIFKHALCVLEVSSAVAAL